MLHYIIIFRIIFQVGREEGLGCSKYSQRYFWLVTVYMELYHLLDLIPLVYFENFSKCSRICFGGYPFHQSPYFHSILKVKLSRSSTISLLTSCTERKMLLGTFLDIYFDGKAFVVCNLFHKTAFMNFPKTLSFIFIRT